MAIESSFDTEAPAGFAQTANLDLDLSKGRGLKKVPTEIKYKAIQTAVEEICKRENLQHSIEFIGGVNTAIITCGTMAETKEDVDADAERVYRLISEWLVHHFDTILANETGGNPSEYFRTTTFFECSIENGIINLYWS